MKERLVVSVPHTGTRFVKQRLDIKTHVHTITTYSRVWDMVEEYDRNIVIPLRHPQDVLRSWITRDKHKQRGWLVQFSLGWALLQELSERCDAEIIPVDLKQHEEIDNWNPVGHNGSKPEAHDEAMRISIFHIFTLPIVKKYYLPRPLINQPYLDDASLNS